MAFNSKHIKITEKAQIKGYKVGILHKISSISLRELATLNINIITILNRKINNNNKELMRMKTKRNIPKQEIQKKLKKSPKITIATSTKQNMMKIESDLENISDRILPVALV